MRWLITILAASTATTHIGFGWFTEWTTPARAFYVLRGLEGVTLFLALLWLSDQLPLRRSWRLGIATVTMLGAVTEALTSVCGAAFYWGKGTLPVSPPTGLMCDAAHPAWMAWSAITICTVVLYVTLRTER